MQEGQVLTVRSSGNVAVIVAKAIVGSSASAVTQVIIKNQLAGEIVNRRQRLMLKLGTAIIGSMVGTAATEHVEKKIAKAYAWWMTSSTVTTEPVEDDESAS